jgi:hypothetical protein
MTFASPSKAEPKERRKYVPCEVATDTRDAILDTIEEDIENAPRTLQTAIGPSSIGDPCDWCLGHRLIGAKQDSEPPWLAWVGNAVHKGMEGIFRRAGPPWLPEAKKLYVGDIDGERIFGTSDLMRLRYGDVTDFKYVGNKTLTKVRYDGPTPGYRVQGHLYGRGWAMLGFEVNNISILYLPREAQSLRKSSVWWAEAYDEKVALDALARADELAKRLHTFGPDAILPTLARLPGCYDCERWAK